MYGPTCVPENCSERSHLCRRSGKAVNQQRGAITPLPKKGSVFTAVERFWKNSSRHGAMTLMFPVLDFLQQTLSEASERSCPRD